MRYKHYIIIFLISLATLALEISLIRFFSITQWYHFAFMIVSIAMFGIAAAGTFLSIKKIKNPKFFLILFSLSVLIGFFILNNISFDPFKANINFYEIFKLSYYYILLGLPFFFFGIIIAYYFLKFQEKSGKIYFFNLLGSSLGVIIVIPLLVLGPKIIIIISVIPLFSLLFYKKWIKFIIPLMIILSLLFFLPININLSPYKELNQALNYPNSKLLFTKYNSFSRVDLVNSSFTRYAPGLSSIYNKELPEQIGVLIDGSGMNAITNNGDFVNYLPTSIGYYLIKEPKVLILNAGAGLDVLAAIKNNATITALEINSMIVDLLKNNYREFSNNIYNKANVFIEEGRSFIKKGKYDLIIISLSGNVLSSEFSSFNENYLLTKEAFKDYYNSLTGNGYLIITRWLDYPPREAPRLFSLALTVGPDIAMFRSLQTVTLVLSKDKLNKNKITKIKEFTDKNKFDLIYFPGNFTPNKYAKFKEPYYYNIINNILKKREKTYNEYLFNIKPVSDDKPFYFNFFRWKKFPELYKLIGKNWQPFLDSGFLLLFLFFQALILALTFILLPLYFYKKLKIKKNSLIYFFCIGIAYLFIEIFFIQKLILFLGHIIYSTTVTIFSLLLFSSIGALVSEKLKIKNIKKIILLLFLFVVIYYFIILKLLNILIVLDLFPKIIISILLIMPIAFLMGFPFPIGIRIINKELIPWAWAVNGAASVLSPIVAILIALFFGYSFVLILAGIVYIIGLFILVPFLSLEQT